MGLLQKFLIRFSRRDDRGVTGIEYALVLSVMLVGTTATFEMMDEGLEEHYTDTAEDIGQKDIWAFDVTTTTTAGVVSSTTSTTTTTPAYGTSTTTTTAAPTTTTTTTTTAAPTTTTTTSTTTTTAPPTTTTAAAAAATTTTVPDEQATTSWRNRTYRDEDGWVARARVTLRDQGGEAIRRAKVSVTFTLADGTTASTTGNTNSWGRVTFKWEELSKSDFDVTVTINSIVGEDGTTYAPSITTYVLDT